MSEKDNRIVWIDLEMTGLDIHRHTIVEMAVLVTDADLNILGDGIDLTIHATEAELAEMDEVVTQMHTANGLVDEIRASTITLAEAEAQAIAYIDEYCAGVTPPLAGNSIATDRSFIRELMPTLDERLHYRMIDVSTVKLLAKNWAHAVYKNQPEKGTAHRALADIVESIRELDYYRRCFIGSRPVPAVRTLTAQAAATRRFTIPS
ncbi:MAG: oligoribonuclease [Corynebacterium sp.]|nr:oligoribonuclease [Corynebacterium sp.]